YFFHKAKEDAERAGQAAPDDKPFRYLGPKPQSRETAMVMIGDMVVATARSSGEASPEKLKTIVDHAIRAVVDDAQLDECDLTLRDLEGVRRSFVSTLSEIMAARTSQPPPAQRPNLRILKA
ncbi:MAG: hypothetical protein JST92_27710, partial [Deltaproteobacteria bacterium]|nr:hypothetical protein [Deltaproteobacteria bacterium]